MMNQSQLNHTENTSQNAWWTGLLGVVELFLGFFALVSPWIIGTSFIWAIGIILMCLAVFRLIQVFTVSHARWWSFISAVLYALVGWFLVRDPGISLAVTTLIVGWGLTIAAVFQGALWIASRSLPAAGWRLFNVIITFILGLLVIFGWPESTAWFIGTLIAVELIFSGWTLLLYAFGSQTTSPDK